MKLLYGAPYNDLLVDQLELELQVSDMLLH